MLFNSMYTGTYHFNFTKATICDFCAITAFGEGDERSNKTVFEVRDMVLNSFLLPITPSKVFKKYLQN